VINSRRKENHEDHEVHEEMKGQARLAKEPTTTFFAFHIFTADLPLCRTVFTLFVSAVV
jgi:hypothetical protein